MLVFLLTKILYNKDAYDNNFRFIKHDKLDRKNPSSIKRPHDFL